MENVDANHPYELFTICVSDVTYSGESGLPFYKLIKLMSY